MTAASELRVALERNRGELVRSFVREACLCDEIPLAIATSAADHTAEVWRALCEQASPEPVRLLTDSSGHELKIRILLRGYSQFSALAFQDSTLRVDAAIDWRPRGIDGWEVSIHHRLGVPETLVTPDDGEPSAVAAIHSSTDYIIESPRKDDAPAIARCFLKVYGHRYVHSEVFSPRRYWDKIERGELVPVIARDTRGDVVGHVALEREPGAKVAERGEAVVDPDHRGRGLLERMTECLSDRACTQGLDGIYAEPLTIHTFSQRNDERVGMPVCAALLGVNPEKFGPKNMHSTPIGQRQSYLRTFRFVRPTAPRTLQAPDQYRDILSELYADLGVAASLAAPYSPSVAPSKSSIKANGRGYAVITYETIGSEAGVELRQAFGDVRALGATSVQLSAIITDPRLPQLSNAARELGFFCGLGPGFANGADTFSLQWLGEPLDTGKLQLFTDRAKRMIAFIDLDRAAVASAR